MSRSLVTGVVAGLALLAASCSSDPMATSGVLSIAVDYVQPPPGRPMSIGGYAGFAEVRTPDGEQVWAGEIRPLSRLSEPQPSSQLLELSAGDYDLEVSIRPASDAVVREPDGSLRRDFGPVSASCDATVRISPPDVTIVLVTVVGGDACSIGPAE